MPDLGRPKRTAGADASPEQVRAVFHRLAEDVRRAEAAVAELVRAQPPGEGPVRVETVDAAAAQARRILELETGARRTFQAFLTGVNRVTPVPATLDPPADGSSDADGARPSAPPEVTYQLLVDRDFLAEPAAVAALEERVRRGEQVRVVDSPLLKLAVADGETAMVQFGPERAVLMRPPLTTLVTELFATAWRHSRPYLREVAELSAVDRQILQLMLSGLTDAATAKQLGTSPRTVQRRLRALMDLASVTSRLQLGWYAMRNNWI
ncbi:MULTISPECIES: helix-turn-helix transcriptional regulator [unclassified Streptomyces]|uniref:helix-turn-helix transcriptional regulator n=1 Tax=unclassified Streptomyces TaxID=2593676 RepID=UPI00192927E9|nr:MULTISPECIES: helix-turn-helix transcriptional regulator [unclassified Streptomyces]